MGTTHFVRAKWRADCPDREPDLIYKTTDGYRCWRWNPERIEMLEHRYLADPGPGLHVHHVNHDRMCNESDNLDPLTPREHRRRHSVVTDEDLLALHDRGWTTIAIGIEVGLHHSQVWRRLHAAGATLGQRSGNRTALTTEQEQEILLLQGEGWRSGWIGERLGVSKYVIRRVLRNHGRSGAPAGRPSVKALQSRGAS